MHILTMRFPYSTFFSGSLFRCYRILSYLCPLHHLLHFMGILLIDGTGLIGKPDHFDYTRYMLLVSLRVSSLHQCHKMAEHGILQEHNSILPSISPQQSNPKNTLKVDSRLQPSPHGSRNQPEEALGATDEIKEVHTMPPSRKETLDDAEGWDTVDNITALGLAFGHSNTPEKASSTKKRFPLEDMEPGHTHPRIQPPRPPFEKWVRSFNRKATLRHRRANSVVGTGVSNSDLHSLESKNCTRHRLRKSASGSSLGFVTAVKSASISLASFSITAKSRNRGHSSRHQKTDRSSRASNIDPRTSEDSAYATRGIANDVAVTNRSIRRRRVLEEIISTEEGYFGDVKFLMNVSLELAVWVRCLTETQRCM